MAGISVFLEVRRRSIRLQMRRHTGDFVFAVITELVIHNKHPPGLGWSVLQVAERIMNATATSSGPIVSRFLQREAREKQQHAPGPARVCRSEPPCGLKITRQGIPRVLRIAHFARQLPRIHLPLLSLSSVAQAWMRQVIEDRDRAQCAGGLLPLDDGSSATSSWQRGDSCSRRAGQTTDEAPTFLGDQGHDSADVAAVGSWDAASGSPLPGDLSGDDFAFSSSSGSRKSSRCNRPRQSPRKRVRTRDHQKSAGPSRTASKTLAQRSHTARAAPASAAGAPHSRLGSSGADGLRFFGLPPLTLVLKTTPTEHSTAPPGDVGVPGPGAQAAGGS